MIVAQCVVAVRLRCVGAEAIPFLLNLVPATGEVAIVGTVATMRDVVVLSHVDGLVVSTTVALVVTHGLHVVLLACLDHDIREGARCGLEVYRLRTTATGQ